MKNKGNIAIFVPHAGCPHQCSFCDQRKISAAQGIPSPEQVQQLCQKAVSHPRRPKELEIAFFGGSFTAIPETQQNALLEAVQPFVQSGSVSGIRISTRPDCITPAILQRLQSYHVTAIELGAQSMEDRVLQQNRRGHTEQAVRTAAKQIADAGFSLGLQMMVGLYGSTIEQEYATLRELLALHPEKVFLNLGEADLDGDLDGLMEQYEWLLYTLHNHCRAKLYLTGIMQRSPSAVAFNKRLQALAAEDGCTFIDLAPALESENAGLRAFELMRYDMRLHPITLTEAMQVADFCSSAG